MRLDRYMALCLLDPEAGYYATRDPFGQTGDFITAPEISQLFGEMVGLCLAQSWMDQGCPAPFLLAEAGPGRGTLMADILRVVARVPNMADAARIHLVEASATLRGIQAETLAGYEVTWADAVDALPQDRPLFFVANEFIDALPIRQFTRTETGWAETQVGAEGGQLRAGRSPATRLARLEPRFAATNPGDVVEICPHAATVVEAVAQRLVRGGMALFVDYGDWRSLGDTFQALRAHVPVDPFATPGEADLTAHVDFEALACAAHAAGVAASAMTPQGLFLERLGITARAQALAKKLSGAALEAHIAAHRRLTHPEEMGQLFKALALYPEGAPLPPGLSPSG
ncbi:SAM-dependent methyltransferase [Thioclava litoralis]|uniref:SAM-dependent methyltransferase n=1 Tax=Thioclava litoralis TaxID=3076557 RepID=A0ABZ1E5G0_9RHOB|nr:SAM-dependent methyltransferase [Thioclava sp. FTW29]